MPIFNPRTDRLKFTVKANPQSHMGSRVYKRMILSHVKNSLHKINIIHPPIKIVEDFN